MNRGTMKDDRQRVMGSRVCELCFLAGSNDEVAESFFKEIDHCFAVVIKINL
jgi:hypothetical protein